jgi:hypothetical protein
MYGDELRLVHLPAIFSVVLFVSSLFGLLLVVLERAVTGLLGLQVTDAQARYAPRVATGAGGVAAIGVAGALALQLSEHPARIAVPLFAQQWGVYLLVALGPALLAARVRPAIGRWLLVVMVGVHLMVALSFLLVLGGLAYVPGLAAAVAVVFAMRGTRIGTPVP